MTTLMSRLAFINPELHAWMLVRLLMAALLGSFVGYERERTGKPAGLRTHGMVGLGAALFTVVSLQGFGLGSDSSRVAAMIVSGIGFIGAGAILHERGGVQGLTTAASLWATAAIGMAVGVGMFSMSIATTILVFALLRFAPKITPKAVGPTKDPAPKNRLVPQLAIPTKEE